MALSECNQHIPGPTAKSVNLNSRASSAAHVYSTISRLFYEVISRQLLMHQLGIITSSLRAIRRLTRQGTTTGCIRPSLFSSVRRISGKDSDGSYDSGISGGTQSSCASSVRIISRVSRRRIRRAVLSVGHGFNGGTIVGKVSVFTSTANRRHGQRVKNRTT